MTRHADLRITRESLRAIATQLKSRYRDVDADIEGADWVTLLEMRKQGNEVPGEFEIDYGADGYIWVRGPADSLAPIADEAKDLAEREWEDKGVTLVVKSTNQLWCRKSRVLEVVALGPRGEYNGPTLVTIPDARHRDVQFFCLTTEEHGDEHEWGNVTPN